MKRLALLLPLVASPALAGDFATLAPIGFSADGTRFLFEQHGIQDGSGFPYAEIHAVELDGDAPPPPVRVRLEDEGASLAEARRQARAEAAAAFGDLASFDAGLLVAAQPPTELSADPHRVVFLPRAIEPTPDAPIELRLTLVPFFGAEESCEVFGHTMHGFRLVRVATEPGEAATVIHEDTAMPTDRGCPYDYRIAEVRVRPGVDGPERAVAVIGITQVGFEGPDLRYRAVPLPLAR